MTQKCEICRFPCKSDEKTNCKFYPQEHQLGNKKYFVDHNPKKHDSTSRMCIICKQYFSYGNIRWKKEKEGLYPFCADCFKTALFIDEMLLNSGVSHTYA